MPEFRTGDFPEYRGHLTIHDAIGFRRSEVATDQTCILKDPERRLPDEKNVSDADQTLDASGLTCPLPLLKAKQALNKLEAGEVLEVVCTDPSSVRDFRVFSEQSGHPLLKSDEDDGNYTYWLKKA